MSRFTSRMQWISLATLCAALACAALVAYAPAAAARPSPSGARRLPPSQPATGTQILLNGAVDSASQMPLVRLHLSVLDTRGGLMTGLAPTHFAVTEDGAPADGVQLAEEQVGLALMIVLDRGGLAQPGVQNARRWDDAVQLAVTLTQVIAQGKDYVGLVAVDAGQNVPTVTLALDGQAVPNALQGLEPVSEPTALYDGLCAALDALASDPRPEVAAALGVRRKAIVVFADTLDNSSSRCTATDVRDRARAQAVSIYTVGMSTPEDQRPQKNYTPLDPTQLAWLAAQTGGLYFEHGDAAGHSALIAFFQRLSSQRKQYLLSFYTHAERGEHALSVRAEIADGSASLTATFTSSLQLPSVALTAPASGLVITRPRGVTVTTPLTVPLNVVLTFPDGLIRNPARVEYRVNGQVVSTRAAEPYSAEWNVAQVATGTYAVEAHVYDGWLTHSPPVTTTQALVEIVLEPPRPPDQLTRSLAWLQANLLTVVCIPATTVLLIAAVLMHRQVIATVRLTAQRLTEAMPGVFGPARGRLVITRGAAAGREYRLVKAVTILGREQALCDIALEDRFVSARHATIRLDAHGNFAMTDEGSQNGTLVNGVRIPPRQLIPLPFDSTIRLGETEMVLRQTGAAPMAHPG